MAQPSKTSTTPICIQEGLRHIPLALSCTSVFLEACNSAILLLVVAWTVTVFTSLQADAEQHGEEAEKQPFLIWEDRGGGDPTVTADLLSEDEEPADAASQVSLLMHWTSHLIDCMLSHQQGEIILQAYLLNRCDTRSRSHRKHQAIKWRAHNPGDCFRSNQDSILLAVF